MSERGSDRMALAARGLVVALLLAGVAPARAQGDTPDTDTFARLVAETAGLTVERELERRAGELARTPEAVRRYLELLARDARAGATGDPLPLDEAQRRLLARTAELLDSSAIVAEVRGRLGTASDDAWRAPALELLALHGSTSQLSLLAELALDATRERPRAELTDAFTRALTRLLVREGVSARPLDWLVDEAAPLKEAIVRAVGRASDPEGLVWLASYLGDHQVGQAALQEIGRLAGTSSGEAAAIAAERIHPILAYEGESWRRGALRALGSLAQPASVPWLLASLERERGPGERRMTFAALREIAGISLPDDAGVWGRWHEQEKAWYQERGPSVAEKLASEDDSEVVEALLELSSHPLQRERIAASLSPLLEHPSSTVRIQTCLVLGRLASRSALDELARALEDDEREVRDAACRALAALTGTSHGTDAVAWRAALEARERGPLARR